MKRTVNINLNGIVITIDEDAAKELNNYIDKVKEYYRNKEFGEEIVMDIEYRIAEILLQKKKNKASIDISDVQQLINQLGNPEEFEDYDEQKEQYQTVESSSIKRLFRDPDNKILCGVCSGLGHYFGIDPFWIRLVWALAFFFYGSGFLLYILLCIIIPQAKTTADKLEMRGEPVNFQNLKKTVEKEFKNVKNTVNQQTEAFKNTSSQNPLIRFFDKILHFVTDILTYAFKFLAKLISLFFIFIASVILIAIIAVFFGEVDINANHTHLGDVEILSFIFDNTIDQWIFAVSASALIGIPLFILILLALKYLLQISFDVKKVILIAMIIWIAGFIVTGYETVKLIGEFDHTATVETEFELPELTSDTLHIALSEPAGADKSFRLLIQDEQIKVGSVKAEIIPSKDTIVKIILVKKALGDTPSEAEKYAQRINYSFNIQNNTLILSPFMTFNLEEKMRLQKLNVKIFVPETKIFYLHKDADEVIDQHQMADRFLFTNSENLFNHYLQFKHNRLTCLDCE
ncbi:MAG: PspC domain-containing protein [Bacteroidetes bacterium]|nr:MAG: PspC domain-containing protein [Bacteroidota bacterium]